MIFKTHGNEGFKNNYFQYQSQNKQINLVKYCEILKYSFICTYPYKANKNSGFLAWFRQKK